MDISELLRFALESGGSDLHISAGEPPVIRIHGEMTKVDLPPLDKEDVHNMIYDILSDFQRKVFEEHLELDFSLALVTWPVSGSTSSGSTAANRRSSGPFPAKYPPSRVEPPPRVQGHSGLEKGLSSSRGPPAAASRRRLPR
jgi:twitching motility protein PilT